jgi:hypothetical protein
VIAPSAVDEKQFAQIAKLPYGNICASSSLQTFDTADTHTDMSSLNHGNVVGAISNSKQNSFQMTFDKLDN